MPKSPESATELKGSVIYELDFPCGCRTQRFDPREWTLCERHISATEAMVDWAAWGANVYRALLSVQMLLPARIDRLDLRRAAEQEKAGDD